MRNEKVVNIVVVALLFLSLITLVASPAYAEGDGEIYPTDDEGNRRDEFLVDHDIFFDAFGDPLTEYRIRLILIEEEDESTIDQIHITTDQNGNYHSYDEAPPESLEHTGVGDYYLEMYDPEDEEVLDTYNILVYEEQDFRQGSWIETYDEDGEETNNFDENEWVHFEGEVLDQFGNPPEEEFPFPHTVRIFVQRAGEERILIDQPQVEEDGEVEGDFRAWQLDGPGDYTLMMYDADGEVEYARDTFTIIGVEIDIEQEYTQGQEMEIRIESNFEQTVNIQVENDLGEVLEGGEWTDQEFTTDLWIEEYTIPEDEPDGTYYVVVYSTDYEELARESFDLKKYSLEAVTGKAAYLPGETADVHYTVERQLDGAEAQDLEIEYRLTYIDDNLELRTETYEETYDGHFNFEVPEDITIDRELIDLPSPLEIELWANGTDDEHTTYWNEWIYVGELEASFDTDGDEYLQGQTIYVTTETYVSPQGWGVQSPVEDAQITVNLKQEGNIVGGYETIARTNDRGEVVLPIHLSEDISTGIYHVNLTAEKLDLEAYPTEEEIQIYDEIKRLNVLLERDKESYSPGENVNVSYEVTKEGDQVDANVRYEVMGPLGRVYEKSYADRENIVFSVPDNFNQDGSLELSVYAKMDQQTEGTASMEIPVHELQLLLNADQTEYEGGETIDFEYELVGTQETTSVIYKIIEDPGPVENGDIIETNETEDNQFEFQVPDHPASSYEVKLEAVSANGFKAVESLELRRASRIQLEISIDTDSSYTTDVYEPGDEIEIRYRLRAVGDAKIPDKIDLHYSFQSTGQSERIQTNSPDGTFTIEVPEVSDGTYFLHVETVEGISNTEPVEVEEDPSLFSLRMFGGLSLLGLLGIIILLIILGIGYYSLSSYEGGMMDLDLPELSKKEEEKEKEESSFEPTEESEEDVSPAEKVHGWKGPEEKETEDSDQIEPDE